MIKRLSLLLLLTGLFYQTLATHIVGGDFTYRWISGNTYEIRLVIFRDCNSSTPFDSQIIVGIFDRGTNQVVDSIVMTLGNTDSLQLAGSLCSPPPEICVESGTYLSTLILANNPSGYYLSWERCCRNHTVENIIDPGATGMVFYVEMPDPVMHNSSPVFLNDPLPYMCENQSFNYNFNGFDPDGDSLTYELVSPSGGNSSQISPILPNPIPGPYSDALFQPPYSLVNICGGIPLAVNLFTGLITATPNLSGIFAMAVLVHEYRNGIQIGLIRREIEFTVIICDGNITPQIQAYENTIPVSQNFEIYETDSLCFQIKASDLSDSLYLTYSGDCFAGSGINPPYAVTSNSDGFLNVITNFCWHTSCDHGRSTPYQVNFEIRDNGCPIPITTVYQVTILVKPIPLIKPLNLLCISTEGLDSAIVFWSDSSANDPFLSYYLVYRSVNGSPYSIIDTVYNKSQASYIDISAFDIATNNYCYFFRSVNICGDFGSNSDTLCTGDAKNDNPNYIESVSVTDHNKIQLKIEHFPDAPYSTFFVYRKENDSLQPFTLYKTLNGIQNDRWEDTDVLTSEHSYCYYLINRDYCGNVSPASNEARSILLTGHSVPFLNTIHWTEYINWRGGVFDYEIYRKTDELPDFPKLTNVEYLVFSLDDKDLDYDFGRYRYRVKALEGSGGNNAESYSNEVDLFQPPLVFVPNAFTPNDDFANETWEVSSIFIKDFELRIYNRYGQLIFISKDKHLGWDGTFKGQVAPQGVYIYDIRYTSYSNPKESKKTGTITLLK